MLLQIITFYCVCDAYLKEIGHANPPSSRMTDAEVMTTVLVAVWFFGSNYRLACAYLKETGLIPAMLQESWFTRRRQALPLALWQGLLPHLAESGEATAFSVDSCPVPVCRMVRAGSSRLYRDERRAYFGYCAAKKERFFGLKAHLVVDGEGRPVELELLCGCTADIKGLKELALDLPEGSVLYADKGYNDYAFEDSLQQEKGIRLLALRRSASKRPHEPGLAATIRKARKRIETTFSEVAAKFARHIHAVTEKGFEVKVVAAFVAYAILNY